MNAYFVAAAVLALVVACGHAVLGEALIFRKLRIRGLVPTNAPAPLRERHVRLLWATWHITSIMGCAFAALLFGLAQPVAEIAHVLAIAAVSGAMLGSSILVLIATKGRHLGWIGLLAIALLAVLGAFA
jgi:hypothetical protein